MQFEALGLDAAIVRAVTEQGYTEPSPIQAQAIPPILSGRDVMAAAQTGTGKTAGFTLPMLQRLAAGNRAGANQARALILTPTRELAAQVLDNVRAYSAHLPLGAAVVYGGVKINPQMMRLRRGVDILVATPGRLLDLVAQNAIKFGQLEILVLDEADRMLDMGFIHDIRKILAILPKQRQTLMFSATFSNEIRELAQSLLRNPVQIAVAPRNSAVPLVSQLIHPVDKAKKVALLIHLIKQDDWQQALVFSRTKHGADRIARQLQGANISAASIHGDKHQGERTRALAEFKQGKIRILVATDIAARGLDIDQLPQVANFDLPNVPEDYVHRIGRTGRAGAKGQAVSLVSADEIKQLIDIERLIGKKIERDSVWGFEPVHDVPDSPNPRAQPVRQPAKANPRGAGARGPKGGPGPGRGKPAAGARSGSKSRGTSGSGKPRSR